MKIRIGLGLGTRTQAGRPEVLGPVVEAAERLGFDSLWFSERVGGEAPDPVVAMTYAIARTTKLKVGMSVMVLPGRNPVLVAKELASLDVLSGGRLLPAFGLGVADPHEQQAFGVKRGERAKPFDEAQPPHVLEPADVGLHDPAVHIGLKAGMGCNRVDPACLLGDPRDSNVRRP